MSFARPGSKLLGESLKQGLMPPKTLNTLHTESLGAVLAIDFRYSSQSHVSTDMNPWTNTVPSLTSEPVTDELSTLMIRRLRGALLRHLMMTP